MDPTPIYKMSTRHTVQYALHHFSRAHAWLAVELKES